MKKCSRCKKEKDDLDFWANQNWCKQCYKDFKKTLSPETKERYKKAINKYRETEGFKEKHRKEARKYYIKNKDKAACRDKVRYALKMGRLKKQPCWCGETKVEAHHEDYSKPLDVVWFCFKHHREYENSKKG